MFPKLTRWESKKWRDAAKGQPCTMQITFVCLGGEETTVLAHRNGGGMGTKTDDFDAADMCAACHDLFDGRTHYEGWPKDQLTARFEKARFETIANRLRRGILK